MQFHFFLGLARCGVYLYSHADTCISDGTLALYLLFLLKGGTRTCYFPYLHNNILKVYPKVEIRKTSQFFAHWPNYYLDYNHIWR